MLALLYWAALTLTHADAIDTAIERVKPLPADDVATAARKCTLLAEDAVKRGVDFLVIGFEGQGGFNPRNTWLVYRHYWNLTHGSPEAPPVLDNSAPILHRLMLPLTDSYSPEIEILNFPETAVRGNAGGVPEACALAWLSRRGPGHPRLVLLGHSFGVDAAHDLALILGQRGLPVDQAYSADPVTRSPSKRFEKPGNVRHWINFIQRNEPPFGSVIVKATHNYDLSPLRVNHRTIVRSPPVLARIRDDLFN